MKKRRDLKSKTSGQAAEKAKKSPFFDMLSFLDEYVEDNR